MSKLVEIRINDAIGSIMLVQNALNKAKERRAEAAALSNNVLYITDEGILSDVDGLFNQIKRARPSTDSSPRLPPRIVDTATKGWRNLQKELKKIESLAKELKTYRFEPSEWQKHLHKSTDLLTKSSGSLNAIQGGLKRRPERELLQAFEKARPFWEEHLETVAGIVLRDEGFDEDLSVLADSIVELCGDLHLGGKDFPRASNAKKDTLNVLGKDQTRLKDLNHTVYFRFPAWSVWGLPLMAHDVWHASDQGDERFQQAVAPILGRFNQLQVKTIWSDALVQDCLADTFATVVLGPAYAFACVLLILDVNSNRDQVRAEVILASLKRILPYTDEKDSVVFLLRETWNEARSHAVERTPARVECILERDCHAVENLLTAYWDSLRDRAQQDIDASVGLLPVSACAQADASGSCRLARVRCKLANADENCPMASTALIQEMCDTLIEFMPKNLRYQEDIWSGINGTLLEFLKKHQPVQDESNGFANGRSDKTPELLSNLDLRYILYGAWFARLSIEESEVDMIRRISENAKRLCREATKKPEPGKRPQLHGDKFGSYANQ